MLIYSILTYFLCFSSALSRIIEGKEKDDPKTIPLKIFAKDIGNCAYVRFSSFVCVASISTKMNTFFLIVGNYSHH